MKYKIKFKALDAKPSRKRVEALLLQYGYRHKVDEYGTSDYVNGSKKFLNINYTKNQMMFQQDYREEPFGRKAAKLKAELIKLGVYDAITYAKKYLGEKLYNQISATQVNNWYFLLHKNSADISVSTSRHSKAEHGVIHFNVKDKTCKLMVGGLEHDALTKTDKSLYEILDKAGWKLPADSKSDIEDWF
jgi:hypothetical protein